MADTVAQMTKEELREMIEAAIEKKLLEMFGDPDEGLEIRKSVRERLLRQKKAVAAGQRGEPFEKAELIVQEPLVLPPEVTDPAEQTRLLKMVTERMQRNPIPAGAPRLTREELHERC